MSTKLERALFNSAAIWTVLGLASGLYYRELTRQLEFTGRTQLSVAHTHALTLGTIVLLLALGLTRVFKLDADPRLRFFVGFWNAGLALTFGMLTFKGTLQVLGNELAASKAIAGVSGLGHMVLTGTFVLLFLIIRRALAKPATPTLDADAHVGSHAGSSADSHADRATASVG